MRTYQGNNKDIHPTVEVQLFTHNSPPGLTNSKGRLDTRRNFLRYAKNEQRFPQFTVAFMAANTLSLSHRGVFTAYHIYV